MTALPSLFAQSVHLGKMGWIPKTDCIPGHTGHPLSISGRRDSVMRAVLSACHLLGMPIQLRPLGRMCLPGLFLHLYNGTAIPYMEIYSENDIQEDVMPWAWVCFHACHCFVLCSGLGAHPPCAPVLQSVPWVWAPWCSWRSATHRTWDVSTLHRWHWPAQEPSHLRGLCTSGSS